MIVRAIARAGAGASHEFVSQRAGERLSERRDSTRERVSERAQQASARVSERASSVLGRACQIECQSGRDCECEWECDRASQRERARELHWECEMSSAIGIERFLL